MVLAVAAAAAGPLTIGAEEAGPEKPVFRDATADLGLRFVHQHFGSGEKYMPENMGPGVALLDVNGDGRLDAVITQGAPVDPESPSETQLDALFIQQPDGTFRHQGLAGTGGNGMGVSFGDVDRNGTLDLYITNAGPNVLLLGSGNGSFEPSAEANAGDPRWSTGATFFDADSDGDLDLFVANYLDFSLGNHKWCGSAARKLRSYCHPDLYQALPDTFYRNDGAGRFVDVSQSAGVKPSPVAKGLGALAVDIDRSGSIDLFVANDSADNQLYLGANTKEGGLEFLEDALVAGLAFNGRGETEASMGIAAGDVTGDGKIDLFLTHLDEETNTLYRNLGEGLFEDQTADRGLATPSLPWVGFGANFLDFDGDGDLDLFVGNGHILDNIELFDASRSYRQPAQLFENDGRGRFSLVTNSGLPERAVVRGSAVGDLDSDGDPDLVLAQNNGPALVLLNQRGHSARHLWINLQGTKSNPQGFGTRLELEVGDRKLTRWILASSSYLSQSVPMAHFGLRHGDPLGTLTIFWPSKRVEKIALKRSDARLTIREGEGVVSRAEVFANAALKPNAKRGSRQRQ